jgi:hypothetical protein
MLIIDTKIMPTLLMTIIAMTMTKLMKIFIIRSTTTVMAAVTLIEATQATLATAPAAILTITIQITAIPYHLVQQ